MERGADDWWRPTGPVPERRRRGRLRLPRRRRPRRPSPTRGRDGSPTGCTGCRARSTRRRTPGRDDAWTGRQLAGATIYELHVGTFTPEGTFDAALGRLDHLKQIGVDFVELMPVNAVNGEHNWGYDGVLWSAVHEPYGGPAGYQRFVDGCHAAGHRRDPGRRPQPPRPVGQLPAAVRAVPQERHATPGATCVNLDGEGSGEVRRYILDNVRMWFEDYHVDGLRLDAVHALDDSSPVHLLEEMAVEVAALSAHHRRPMTLIAESDLNDAAAGHPARGRRLRARRPVERRLPPRGARRAHRGDRRLLRRLRAALGPGQGGASRASSTTGRGRPSAAGRTARRSTSSGCPAGGSWCAARTTTRSATAPAATGSPRRSTTTSWCAPRC